MKEYIGRINLAKEDMLFVVNNIFEQNVKENMTKEAILTLIPQLYCEENYDKLLMMLSYKGYQLLEKLIQYVDENGENADINKFDLEHGHLGIRDLEEALIIVLRAKHGEYNYSLNKGVLENLKGLFSEKNENKAKRYGVMEKLILGLLYSYGVVNLEFFRKELSRHMKEIISEEELYDFIFYRLNLNPMITIQTMVWKDIKEEDNMITYLENEVEDFEEIVSVFAEQKRRKWDYKLFSKKELMAREEHLWNEKEQKLYEFIRAKTKNSNKYFFDFTMKRYAKKNEIGKNVLEDLKYFCEYESEAEIIEFMNLFLNWYNNAPQYQLGGYSPVELREKYR